MKLDEIEEYEIGDHCFGPILRINDKEYNEYSENEIIKIINESFENDINKSALIRECFEKVLSYLPFDIEKSDSYTCDCCGYFNSYAKFKKL